MSDMKALRRQISHIQDYLADIDGMDDAVEIHEERINKMEGEQNETERITRVVIRRWDNRFLAIERRLARIEKDIRNLHRKTGEEE